MDLLHSSMPSYLAFTGMLLLLLVVVVVLLQVVLLVVVVYRTYTRRERLQ
jgi:hypothetical protein